MVVATMAAILITTNTSHMGLMIIRAMGIKITDMKDMAMKAMDMRNMVTVVMADTLRGMVNTEVGMVSAMAVIMQAMAVMTEDMVVIMQAMAVMAVAMVVMVDLPVATEVDMVDIIKQDSAQGKTFDLIHGESGSGSFSWFQEEWCHCNIQKF